MVSADNLTLSLDFLRLFGLVYTGHGRLCRVYGLPRRGSAGYF